MGTWSVSITGNDTARDLASEYGAAFYTYEPKEAVSKIDQYVRTHICDESDEKEWCGFVYSLADYMWKKGILTEEVRDNAVRMIDTGFGLGLWAEAGKAALDKRKRALSDFRAKLLSPMPPKKKIRLNIFPERIFSNGDVVAIQLQTAGKPYTKNRDRAMFDEEFHAYDKKYILLQLIDCRVSWKSAIVPEVKDHWAVFRLFDGVYDAVPCDIDLESLKPVKFPTWRGVESSFYCESSMIYFKKRNYQVIGNLQKNLDRGGGSQYPIFLAHNSPQANPDSEFLAAMGKEAVCSEYKGTKELAQDIFDSANRATEIACRLSGGEKEKRYFAEEAAVRNHIEATLQAGGKMLSIQFGNRTVGIVTVLQGKIDHLYVEQWSQNNGFGTQLLQYAVSAAGKDPYIMVPGDNKAMLHICEKLGFSRQTENTGNAVCFKPRDSEG